MTAFPFQITVTRSRGVAVVSVPDETGAAASYDVDANHVRVALRGHGEFVLRLVHMPVRDLEIRGGHAFVEPGEPFLVRGAVDGWLSVTARLSRPRGNDR